MRRTFHQKFSMHISTQRKSEKVMGRVMIAAANANTAQ
jgi:hypothetical protein